MKNKLVKLTEDDLVRIVKRVIKEQTDNSSFNGCFKNANIQPPESCVAFIQNPNQETFIACAASIPSMDLGFQKIMAIPALIECLGKKLKDIDPNIQY